jgi:pyruvate kinase
MKWCGKTSEAIRPVKEQQAELLNQPVQWDKVIVNDGQIRLNATIGDRQQIILQAGLKLSTSQELEISQPTIEIPGVSLTNPDSFKVDLGAEVELEELTLHQGKIICRGKINVLP